MNDEELKELFSAFDEMSASESLKSATLQSIMAAAGAELVTTVELAETVEEASVPEAEQLPVVEAAEKPVVRATRGGRKGVRAKWRTIRVAAIAACLTLALSGGVAYATPTSYVTVSQGGTTIELGVNCFGIAVSASASDDTGRKLLDEMSGLLYVPYQDCVSRVSDSLKQTNPESPVEVQLQSENGSSGQQHESNDRSITQQSSAPVEQVVAVRDNTPVAQSENGDGGLGEQSAKADSGAASSSNKPAASAPDGIVGDSGKAAKSDSNGGKVASSTADTPSQPSGKTGTGGDEAATTPVTAVEEPAVQPAKPTPEPATPSDSKPETYTGGNASADPTDESVTEDGEDEAPERY